MARETLPDTTASVRGADADSFDLEHDPELEITRERLDGTPVAGWRAPLAAWVERAGVWLGAPATPIASALGAIAPRRLSGWQRRARQGVVLLALTAILFTLLDGVALTRAALGALDRALHPPRPIPTLSASEYALRSLPPTAQHGQHVALAPDAATPGTALACWVTPFNYGPDDLNGQPPQNGQPGHTAVYRTTTGGDSWRPAGAPRVAALDCTVVSDAAGGPGALVIANPGYTTGGLCLTPKLFLTSDGATWNAVPWPQPGVTAPCDTQFALEGDAIYAWSTQPLLLTGSPTTTGRLIVSRDGGGAWASADVGLNDGPGLDIVSFQAVGRILATVPDVRGPPGAATLVESTDYGQIWQHLGDPPGAFVTVYASTDPHHPHGWGRLYALGRPLINGVPAYATKLALATSPAIGAPWTPIPLPPFIAGDETSPEVATPAVLGVGPRDALFVERGVVASNSRAELTQGRRLWAWVPDQSARGAWSGQGQWLLDPQPTFGNITDLAWGWGKDTQTMWVILLQLGVPPTLMLFTRTYTAAGLSSSA